jgi:hypothetical protein
MASNQWFTRQGAERLLLGAGASVLFSSWLVYRMVPGGGGVRPFLVIACLFSLEAFAFGGWKAILVAIGRPVTRRSDRVWLGIFALFILALPVWIVTPAML